jgi:hypothetical protein
MNQATMRNPLALGLSVLALASAPANAERYLVEPVADGQYAVEAVAFSQAELDQMLAPIALFPDSLLSQVLIAATYPLEIVEAARWSRQNPQLRGEEAVAAAAGRGWDPSVLALVAFPDVLAQMDQDLEWTRRLGDAMLYQEAQVMDSIQFLRARADAAGSLESTEFTHVIRQERTIIIEPAQTHIIHVPFYDPWVAFGPWWRPIHPPVVWARPSFVFWGHPGFFWGPAVYISPGFWFTNFHWPQRNVVIVNVPRHYSPPRHFPARRVHAPGQRWTHNPGHRHGVAYRHPEVKERFRQPALRPGPATRWPMEQSFAGNERRGPVSREVQRPEVGRGSGRPVRAWSDDQSRPSDRMTAQPERARQPNRVGSTPDSARQPNRMEAARESARQPDRVASAPNRARPTVTDTQAQLRETRRESGAAPRERSAGPSRQATASTRSVTPPPQAGNSTRSATPPPRASASTQRASPPAQAGASEQASTSPPPGSARTGSPGTRVESRGYRAESGRAAPAPRADFRGASPGRERR